MNFVTILHHRSLFLLEQLRKDGKLPPAGELATPLDHVTHAPKKHDNVQRTSDAKNATTTTTVTLSNGVRIPQLGFGLYKIPANEEGVAIVREAIRAGYRHFDAASVYGNTATLGAAVRQSGIPRRNFFLTTKVWNDAVARGRDAVRASILQELRDLGGGTVAADADSSAYFDLVYIHWPVPGHFVEAYRELEVLHKEGKIRSLGLSNFNVEEYSELVRSSITVPPVVNQFEISPTMFRADLVDFFRSQGIVVVASKSLGRASAFDGTLMTQLSQKHSVSPAQIMLRWGLQKELVPLCKTTHSERMRENCSVHHFSLDKSDMDMLDALTSTEAIAERNSLEVTRKSSH